MVPSYSVVSSLFTVVSLKSLRERKSETNPWHYVGRYQKHHNSDDVGDGMLDIAVE